MSPGEIRMIRVDPAGMTAEELDEFAMKHRVVSLMLAGCSAREAVEQVPYCDYTPGWANKQRRQFEAFGAAGLLDLRKFNGKEKEVMTEEVETLVLRVWHKDVAAGANIITNKVREECKKRGIRAPEESTVRAYLSNLPKAFRMTRGGHFEEWDKQAKPTVPFNPSTRAGDRYQADHTRIDVIARRMIDGKPHPVELSLTVLLDDYSRAVAGIALTEGAGNAWSITRALKHALLPKDEPGWEVCGVPNAFQTDRGADFMSDSVATALGVLGIRHDPDPPYYPNRKGKVERFFQTLDRALLRGLPGHVDAIGRSEGAWTKRVSELLTPEQIQAEITKWIVERYHQETHSVTGRKPLELWQETVKLRLPAESDVFRVLLRMDGDTRKVNPMVNFKKNGVGGRYWSPELFEYYGATVRVAYTPDDMKRIAVHEVETGEFIAELWLLGHAECPFSEEEIRRARKDYRRGLKHRIAGYLKDYEESEGEDQSADEWAEARDEVDSDPEPEPDPEDPEDIEIEEILDDLNKRFRD